MRSDPKSVGALVMANVGPDGISAMDLDRIKIPAGGWESRKEGVLRAAERCPVHETILHHEGIEVTVS